MNLTGTKFLTMVRSEAYKLIHFQGKEFGQFFDLAADSKEKINLWDSPEAAQTKQELSAVLLNWHIDSAVTTRDARKRVVAPPGAEVAQHMQ